MGTVQWRYTSPVPPPLILDAMQEVLDTRGWLALANAEVAKRYLDQLWERNVEDPWDEWDAQWDLIRWVVLVEPRHQNFLGSHVALAIKKGKGCTQARDKSTTATMPSPSLKSTYVKIRDATSCSRGAFCGGSVVLSPSSNVHEGRISLGGAECAWSGAGGLR